MTICVGPISGSPLFSSPASASLRALFSLSLAGFCVASQAHISAPPQGRHVRPPALHPHRVINLQSGIHLVRCTTASQHGRHRQGKQSEPRFREMVELQLNFASPPTSSRPAPFAGLASSDGRSHSTRSPHPRLRPHHYPSTQTNNSGRDRPLHAPLRPWATRGLGS